MARFGRSFIGYRTVPKFPILVLANTSGAITVSGTLADTRTYADAPSGAITVGGTLAESFQHTYADAPSGAIALTGSIPTESNSQTTPVAGAWTVIGTMPEAYARTSVTSGTVTIEGVLGLPEWSPALLWGSFLWGQPSDSYSVVDQPSGAITVGGTLRSEVYRPPTSYNDQPSGAITVGGTLRAVYTATYLDRPSGAVTVSGSAADSRVAVDSTSGAPLVLGGFLRSEAWLLTYTDRPSGIVTVGGAIAEVYTTTYLDRPSGAVTYSGALAEAKLTADVPSSGPTVGGLLRSEAYFKGGSATDVVSGILTAGGSLALEQYVPPVLYGDQLVVTGVGSTDWNGGKAPFGGTHTGQTTITMVDGVVYSVAHSAAEVFRKIDGHAISPTVPAWVAFDQPGAAVPVILNIKRILDISVTPVTQPVVLESVK